MITDRLLLGAHVREALNRGQAVVALESTIITHGMPYPQNLKMARSVEDLVRKHGAVPATIAIMDGQMVAGVDEAALERLSEQGHAASKASRRDLASALVQGGLAGTTVATTMMIAAMAGIHVFATGGIGGVHRGAETSFDISADLEELSRTPVAVVCAGAKAILDIPKTLEVLETHGVPVIGWRTDDFPVFYSRTSGHKLDLRFDDVDSLADMLHLHFDLGLGGALIANPVPEAFEINRETAENWIKAALHQADMRGVRGKDITPFLLNAIFELTGGKSLKTNIELARSNAEVAARIAVALARRG
ncbi:MAG: pseudouridine-5'-phosphate glycosidase [Alphaproteobacteria bacterium]|nr:pseudouridine-5'-phosphate glycosidase [Alphaproteobacteria bacterium]